MIAKTIRRRATVAGLEALAAAPGEREVMDRDEVVRLLHEQTENPPAPAR